MGCNYYWIKPAQEDVDEYGRDDDIHVHIGKRSAAGAYCWDCGTTLCEMGTRSVHLSDQRCFENCPSCGNERDSSGVTSSAFIELGFTKPNELKRTGVTSCSSFTWTLMWHKRQLEDMMLFGNTEKVVVDEYGHEYTAEEFLTEQLASVAFEFQSPYEFS